MKYTFEFVYEDGSTIMAKHIENVTVQASDGSREITGQEILKAKFPINSVLHLRGSEENHTVFYKNLRAIQITLEK